MTDRATFNHVVGSIDELTSHYRSPGRGAIDKVTSRLDDGCRELIALSTFLLVGTTGAEGHQDVSPRGGPAGFARVLDDRRLVIPDLNGNNRLDSLRNIVETGHIALLFVMPGLDETLRVNGRACVTTDPEVLDLFTDQLRRPVTAIGVTIDEAYIHCAKSLRRGGLWDPTSWPEVTTRPSIGRIFIGHADMGDSVTPDQVEERLERSYVEGLAADRPED